MGTTPQKYKLSICCSTPGAVACLVLILRFRHINFNEFKKMAV